MWVAIYIFITAKPPLHQFSKPMKKMRLKDQSMTASVHIGTECLVFVSSHFPKTREKYTNWDNLVCLSLDIFWGQSHLCLLLQTKVFCKSKHRWLCTHKIYKVRQTTLSQFVYFSLVLREWEETITKYSAPRRRLLTWGSGSRSSSSP